MSVYWTGLDELRRELTALPTTLTTTTQPLAHAAARTVTTTVQAMYPHVTGRLAAGVDITAGPAPTYGVNVMARNDAPHAAVYDRGSGPRYTAHGYYRGVMPAADVFVRTAQAARAVFYERIKGLLQAQGFRVTGHVG